LSSHFQCACTRREREGGAINIDNKARGNMRRSFATISRYNNMPAAAFGLLLMPMVANVALADPAPTPNADSSSASVPTIEVPADAAQDANACTSPAHNCAIDESGINDRTYLVETAHPGGTMVRQGPDVAIGRLHPEFAARLAAAIREAREEGLKEVGIFSAYRPPAFGVGGFGDKFNSLHSYGLAVDMYGIGAPGSSEAIRWNKVAAKHGVVCPYGVNNRAEWNHCQPTRIKVVRSDNPLRKTIKAEGPPEPRMMFDAGKGLIESIANLFSAFTGGPATAVQEDRAVANASQRGRRVRTAEARSSRHARFKSGKAVASRTARAAGSKARAGKTRVAKAGTRHRVGAASGRSQRTRSAQLH
jgi:hypothetical protein